MIQSLDANGNKKDAGGDEYYITYKDDSFVSSEESFTSVAHIKDLDNGQYELNFVASRYISPSEALIGTGNITIWLQYTCGIGSLWPPAKQNWQSSGLTNSTYEIHLDASPEINQPSPINSEKSLKTYDAVLALGDSIMVQMFCLNLRMRRPNMFFHENIGSVLKKETLRHYITWVRTRAMPALKSFKNSALVLNSGAWDLAKNNDRQQSFNSHLQSLKKLVLSIRRMLPNVELIWRSTTALHIHRGSKDCELLYYVSESRSRALHEAQMSLMRSLNVPVIDIYNYTYESGYHTRKNDAIHWDDLVFKNIVNELYPSDETKTDIYCKVGFAQLLL